MKVIEKVIQITLIIPMEGTNFLKMFKDLQKSLSFLENCSFRLS